MKHVFNYNRFLQLKQKYDNIYELNKFVDVGFVDGYSSYINELLLIFKELLIDSYVHGELIFKDQNELTDFLQFFDNLYDELFLNNLASSLLDFMGRKMVIVLYHNNGEKDSCFLCFNSAFGIWCHDMKEYSNISEQFQSINKDDITNLTNNLDILISDIIPQ